MSDSSVVVAFEGGLDMVTPVQVSAPGTLVDCMNYEVGPIKGYKRIDGYERFDGGPDGGSVFAGRLTAHPGNPNPLYAIVPGSLITTNDDVTVAEVVEVLADNVLIIIIHRPGLRMPTGSADFRVVSVVNQVSTFLVIDEGLVDLRDTDMSYHDYITAMHAGQASARAAVATAPGRIVGVYRGRDRVYAAIDMPSIALRNLTPAYIPDGTLLRIDGVAYRVVWSEAWVAWLARMPRTQAAQTGLHFISYNQYMAGTGSLSNWTSDDWQWRVDFITSRYAQIYAVEDGYIPLLPTIGIYFTGGTAAFTSTVRLYNNSSIYEDVEVVSYSVSEGSFANGDAAGFMYVRNGVGSSDFTGSYEGLTEIRNEGSTSADATITYELFARVAGSLSLREGPELNGTPTEESTFYQWGTYNFKATLGHEMVFFTTGASQAGWVDDTADISEAHYGVIATGTDFFEDVPKYLAFHADQRLLLGFANGSVMLSAVGAPFNFSGLEGAVELGNGDGITGVLEASGDSTLLFGPRSIRRLVGQGTALALQTISANSGAMDYTAVSVAGTPVYVNHNGICLLEQTSAYGDFQNSSVSGNIDPYFLPRIVQESSSIETGGVRCAFPIRAKNQYRLFLKNGDIINMSLTTGGPQLMRGSYNTPAGGVRLPAAYSSSIGDDSLEYLMAVWDETAIDADRDPPANNLIYRLDYGWGFDGQVFSSFMDTAYMFNEHPNFLTITKAILYGMGYGEATLRLQAFSVEDDFMQEQETTVQDISMPRSPELYYKTMKRVLGEVDSANWGRAIKLRFSCPKAEGSAATEPPHIIQSARLFVQTDGIVE